MQTGAFPFKCVRSCVSDERGHLFSALDSRRSTLDCIALLVLGVGASLGFGFWGLVILRASRVRVQKMRCDTGTSPQAHIGNVK